MERLGTGGLGLDRAQEAQIRHLLMSVQGRLAGGPGQLGDYYVIVARGQEAAIAAKLKSNPIVSAADYDYIASYSPYDNVSKKPYPAVLATGAPDEILRRTGCSNLEAAFAELLPEARKRGHAPVVIPTLETDENDIAIEARNLTMRFGDFVAVDRVNFRIRRGEIFGFLGSNGCGKSTTMKMLTGLLQASEGQAWR